MELPGRPGGSTSEERSEEDRFVLLSGGAEDTTSGRPQNRFSLQKVPRPEKIQPFRRSAEYRIGLQ